MFVLLVPFWAAMAFINAKVMIEINKEWGSTEESVKILQNE